MSTELEIRQHNAFTNARYEYSELQLDLLFFLISKLSKEQKTSVYSLDISDLAKITGKKYHLSYLRQATEDMGNKMFEIETPDRYKQLWLFRTVEFIKGTRIMEVKLSEDILPYLFDLKNNFTSYELAAALRLKSKYAKRIYQFCSQWKDQGKTKKYDIEDFKKMLRILDDKGHDKMPRASDFKASVLDISVKQINEHTELHISYKLEKQGKAFKNIVFTVKPQAQAETVPFTLESTATAPPAGLAKHQVDNASRLLNELGIKKPDLVNAILASAAHVASCNKFAHELKTGKVKAKSSAAGLLLTILGFKKAPVSPLFESN
ncbi:MAG: RepB family plasmid replication initiator protein [Hymenobacter sp.]|nr:MAG: RepB family plasmid replication initiator protein [Hymenobacter sp.]